MNRAPKPKTAKDKFKVGDRVMPTELGIERLRTLPGYKKNTRGTVVGFARYFAEVRIVRDGRKTPENYSMDFWRKV